MIWLIIHDFSRYLDPPMVTIRNQLVGAALGSDLVLECETEAYPKPVSYWSRENGEIVPNGKFCSLYNTILHPRNCPMAFCHLAPRYKSEDVGLNPVEGAKFVMLYLSC